MRTFEELKAEVLENPEVRAEYERLRPEFELAETVIAYQVVISAYVAKLEAWNAYVRAQLEKVEHIENIENIDEAPDVPSGRKIAP